jgi:hypothetical protein
VSLAGVWGWPCVVVLELLGPGRQQRREQPCKELQDRVLLGGQTQGRGSLGCLTGGSGRIEHQNKGPPSSMDSQTCVSQPHLDSDLLILARGSRTSLFFLEAHSQ